MGAAGRARRPGCGGWGEHRGVGGRWTGDKVRAAGSVSRQAQWFPKRTLGTKHLVSLSTVTIRAKGCGEKGTWENQAEVPRVPSCGVTEDTPSSSALCSGGTSEVLFPWEACWRTRGLGFHWQLTTWAASAGTDQSSRLQKAGQVVSMDPIICTVQAESAPLISSRWEPSPNPGSQQRANGGSSLPKESCTRSRRVT